MTWRVRVVQHEDGTTEVFQTRISDLGFAEWLDARDRLRAEGKPDRPPDVDLPTLRAWVPHPGEEDHPYHVANPIPDSADPRGPFPVWSATFGGGSGRRLRVVVLGDPDGTFEATVQGIERNAEFVAFTRDFPAEMDPDAVWTYIEETLIESLAQFMPDDTEGGRMATYSDFEQINTEMREAMEEVARGFVKPVAPEGNAIQ